MRLAAAGRGGHGYHTGMPCLYMLFFFASFALASFVLCCAVVLLSVCVMCVFLLGCVALFARLVVLNERTRPLFIVAGT